MYQLTQKNLITIINILLMNSYESMILVALSNNLYYSLMKKRAHKSAVVAKAVTGEKTKKT
jgi:hypothetical protein